MDEDGDGPARAVVDELRRSDRRFRRVVLLLGILTGAVALLVLAVVLAVRVDEPTSLPLAPVTTTTVVGASGPSTTTATTTAPRAPRPRTSTPTTRAPATTSPPPPPTTTSAPPSQPPPPTTSTTCPVVRVPPLALCV